MPPINVYIHKVVIGLHILFFQSAKIENMERRADYQYKDIEMTQLKKKQVFFLNFEFTILANNNKYIFYPLC